MNNEKRIEACLARIHGEWDNPALMAIGPLMNDTQADIIRIFDGYDKPVSDAKPVDPVALLREAKSAIAALQHEISQMQGDFDDEDGAIQSAMSEADLCTARIDAALKGGAA